MVTVFSVVGEEIKHELVQVAGKEERTVSNLIRVLIIEGLKKRGGDSHGKK